MGPTRVLELFDRLGIIIRNDHFVYTSKIDGMKLHGPAYVNKDGLYPYVVEISQLCRELANRALFHIGISNIECVVGPEKGGVILSQWVGHFLTEITKKPVLVLFAEKIKDAAGDIHFVFNRGYSDSVMDKDVFIIEDVIHTGGSVQKVADLVRQHGGRVRGVGSLCNRGGKNAQNLGVPIMFSLLDMCMESWMPPHCPLCAQGIPVNTKFGHGKELLERARQE